MKSQESFQLKNSVIYEVFLRNFSPEGTFAALQAELPRLKELGVDIIWLMPFYPIGEKDRKGSQGSPYAILDYQSIDPNIGTMDDFCQLVKECHTQGLKLIIDIVFNHTAADALISKEHPEWFLKDEHGAFCRKEPDWSDIIDLDLSNDGLCAYLIECLEFWVKKGVDGFRCDVACMLPLSFWLEARKALDKLNPNLIWLAESVEPSFINKIRARGHHCHSTGELHQAFDVSYDYEMYDLIVSAMKDPSQTKKLVDNLNREESFYPQNYCKLRFLENHDQKRSASLVTSDEMLKVWTAFMFMLPGATLLYNGQEYAEAHLPNLFEKDVIQSLTTKAKQDFFAFLKQLAEIKKEYFHGIFDICQKEDVICLSYDEDRILGFINPHLSCSEITVPALAQKQYCNLLSGKPFHSENDVVKIERQPVILEKKTD